MTKQITELTEDLSPADADFVETQKPTGGVGTSFKVTLQNLLAGIRALVDANTAANSGPVTVHSDVSDAGSGQIITAAERSAIATNSAKVSADGSVVTHSDVSDAGSGAIITAAERVKLAGIADGATNNTGTVNEVEKDSVSQSVARAKLDFRDTGDATVTVTDDPANDRTIVSIDATAGGGGGGIVKGTPFVVGDIMVVEADAGDGTAQTAGTALSDLATAAQGALADTATQPGDNVSTLTNDAGYITKVEDDTTPVQGGDLDTNGFNQGEVFTTAAGNSFAAGNVGVINASGEVVRADNTAEATVKGRVVVAATAIVAGNSGLFIELGDLKGLAGLIAGENYFIGLSGALSSVPPVSGNFMRVVGVARSETILNVNPSADYFTVA